MWQYSYTRMSSFICLRLCIRTSNRTYAESSDMGVGRRWSPSSNWRTRAVFGAAICVHCYVLGALFWGLSDLDRTIWISNRGTRVWLEWSPRAWQKAKPLRSTLIYGNWLVGSSLWDFLRPWRLCRSLMSTRKTPSLIGEITTLTGVL